MNGNAPVCIHSFPICTYAEVKTMELRHLIDYVRQFSSWLCFLCYYHLWHCLSFPLCLLQPLRTRHLFPSHRSRFRSKKTCRKGICKRDSHPEVLWKLNVREMRRYGEGPQGMRVGNTISNSLVKKYLGRPRSLCQKELSE